MIPVKLKMHNFMCYRDNVPPLDFAGIHLACMSGDNGNGKSALIDAMTWALWGQARAKSDDSLIHSGQAEMEVEFDFAVREQSYRIIRKRSRPKRHRGTGQTILELQMAAGDAFLSITGNSIAQTQHKIIDILHMDYDTFINSAYLRQGHADEFTTKRPVERKEVLAGILGLSFYDQLEEEAKEMAKRQEIGKAQLESALKEISGELAQKPTCETELEQAQSELSRIEERLKAKDSELNAKRQEKEALERKKKQLEQLEMHIGDTSKDLELWDEQLKQHQSRVREYEGFISQRATIEDGYARFVKDKKLGEELDQKFRKMALLNERKHHLEMALTEASQGLLREHALAQSKITEMEARSQRLPSLKYQRQQIQVLLRQSAEQEEMLSQKKEAGQELQTQVNYLESNKTRLEREIRETGEKLDLLSTRTEARCPLCETELGLEGLELIRSKYTADGHSKSDSLKSNQAELAQNKTELESLKKDFSQLESRLNQEKTTAQSKAGILEKEIAEAEEADKQSTEETRRLAEIEQRLARKDFASIEQEALRQLEDELNNLSYNSEQHEQVRQRLLELEQYDRSKQKLEEADRLIHQEKETSARAEEAARKIRVNMESDIQKRQELTAEMAVFPQAMNDLTQAETEYQAITAQKTKAQETMWGMKSRLERLVDLEIRMKEKEKSMAQASEQENIYKELAKAFGKGGIQALLIEMALPEIEAEANRLLGRMTDNRMHVKFETQRETRKGDVIETLDINISDELGMRNYEMFSGGEAFRINFAIRIALSRLLAKRAGAPLPTVIIDEGFGTQDSTGIEKLKEAINSIQDDFDKIFVITHIEEFRDAFPTRIDVVKTTEGSTLSVN
ncbi:AAA family ATPase [Chloroflexota bacterium]